MDQNQLARVAVDLTELEYLFDNEQWIPAKIKQYSPISSHAPEVVISLLHHPRDHSGTVYLGADDIKNRLHVKGSN
ncbi:hypothetical protein KSD_50110 [Ktedonobacter sp. SOSP1-85]|uniref:hypothetical protein n=1 Tax=Ktedonobacter sp. SOSP1-85 TaxID=2778367 RepID=UPI0019165296|nr:hypothetical protein [Ktedonobacter sp. SOSP1-85]GHO77240.1 hypothetical protein KSD_50110 [Ktedonobacter sp. SOSP1-85]